MSGVATRCLARRSISAAPPPCAAPPCAIASAAHAACPAPRVATMVRSLGWCRNRQRPLRRLSLMHRALLHQQRPAAAVSTAAAAPGCTNRRRQQQQPHQQPDANRNRRRRFLGTDSAGGSHSAGGGDTPCLVSGRALRAPGLLPAYLADARAVAPYSDENPGGCINLSVAENQMVADMLAPRLAVAGGSFDPGLIGYQQTPGMPQLREAVARYMTSSLYDSQYEVDPQKMIIGAGCNAVLENLFFTIAEPGSAVLVPAPYYAAFDFDLAARVGMELEPVFPPGLAESSNRGAGTALTDSAAPYYPSIASLESAYASAAAKGHPPAALLISSPNNPLGVLYPPEVIAAMLEWCHRRGLHCERGRFHRVRGPF
jgi:hypothetical protein